MGGRVGGQPVDGHFGDQQRFHPARVEDAPADGTLTQLFGDVWEWTSSGYEAYPGFRPLPGVLGEYNGKFMCNQYVLRGGSWYWSASHMRTSWRRAEFPESGNHRLSFRCATRHPRVKPRAPAEVRRLLQAMQRTPLPL